jgi:uncharacterized protein (TIGR03643 family)
MNLSDQEINRIIEMAWEDRTPFEVIHFQFGISEKEVIVFMRKNLKRSSFNLWRKRVNSGVSYKHLYKQPLSMKRFKCTRQKSISNINYGLIYKKKSILKTNFSNGQRKIISFYTPER